MQRGGTNRARGETVPYMPPHKKDAQGCYPNWLGIVKSNTLDKNTGKRRVRLAYRNWYKDRPHEIEFDAEPGSEAYEFGSPNTLFYTALDSKGQLCKGYPIKKELRCITDKKPHNVCIYGKYPAACQKVAALVLWVRAAQGGRRSVRFVYTFQGKRRESTYLASPGTPVFDAKANQLWTIPVDWFGNQCQDNPVTFTKDRCSPSGDSEVCKYAVPGTTAPAKCTKQVTGIATAVGADGRVEFAYMADDGTKRDVVYRGAAIKQIARRNQLWKFYVDSSGALCPTMPMQLVQKKCTDVTRYPVCKFGDAPLETTGPPGCKETHAIVTGVDATGKVTFAFNTSQGKSEDTYVAKPGGVVMKTAKKNQVWRLYIDMHGRICQDKPVKFVKARCDSPTLPDPVCQYGDAQGNKRCGTTETTNGLVTFNQPLPNGKCRLTFKYLKNDRERTVYTAQQDGSNQDCLLKPGQGYAVMRDPKDGAWCGVRKPHMLVRDKYCKKPLNPTNMEICGGWDDNKGPGPAPTPPAPSPPAPSPPTPFVPGPSDGGYNVNVTIENQTKNQNQARAGGYGAGGYGYGYGYGMPYVGQYVSPLLGPQFVLPPEKVVVPVQGETRVLGVYPMVGDNLAGGSEVMVTPQPVATPAVQVAEGDEVPTGTPVDLVTDIPDPLDEEYPEPVFNDEETLEPAGEDSRSTWWYVAIALIIAALLVLGYYLWKKRKGPRTTPLFL